MEIFAQLALEAPLGSEYWSFCIENEGGKLTACKLSLGCCQSWRCFVGVQSWTNSSFQLLVCV